jgi:hypothetical protein
MCEFRTGPIVLHPRNEAKMTKVIDRLARREGRGFMTTLLGLGDFPSCFRRSYMRQIASPPSPLVLWNEQVTKKIPRDL